MRYDPERPPDLLGRTKDFALRIIRLSASLPPSTAAQVMGKQILRSGTSVGAQLRESRRSRSETEMMSKTESALQELEETVYWLELLGESGLVEPERLEVLMTEADELIAILVSGVETLKSRRKRNKER